MRPLLPLLAFGLTLASATISNNKNGTCLTDADTQRLISGFTTIISVLPANESYASQFLSTNFISISDSVNFVDGIPLNTTMTTSLAQLLEQEAALPFVISVQNLFVGHNCDTITWYFEFQTQPLPTRGIAILFVNLETKLIYKSYRESNVGATLYLQGQPECQSNFTVSVGNEGPEPSTAGCERRCQSGGQAIGVS